MITDGRSQARSEPQTGCSSSLATIVAFSFITRTRARLNETTASGSYPAFRTSVRIVILSKEPARLAGIRMRCRVFTRSGVSRQTTRHRRKRQCLDCEGATVHARLDAVAYVEKSARVHGLGGSPCQHLLSRRPRRT